MYSDKALGEFDSNTRSLFVESLWHRKLAHMDSERINKTAQLNKEIIPIRNKENCSSCLLNKTQVPCFKKNPNPASEVLLRVHNDLSGKLPISINGYSYYMTIMTMSFFVFVESIC